MATRHERERLQRQNEKHKNILAILLSREDNKFCADCLCKGPRWTSWNLGVLLCIRCSGLHRSMGVHISRVKSVNLDTWTREQMLHFCRRGNGWAKEMYEAKLPKGFRRPQTDSSMEYFIRDKYEKKKYISPVEITLLPLTGLGLLDDDTPKKQSRKTERTQGSDSLVSIPKPKGLRPVSPGIPRPKSLPQLPKHDDSPVQSRAQTKAPGPTTDDLLGLSSPVSKDAPVSVNVSAPPPPSSDLTEDLFGPLSGFQAASMTTSISSPDLLNGNDSSAATPQEPPMTEKVEDKRLSKDSILSLYSQGTKTSPLANSANFNLTSQANMAYQQQPLQYNQQSFQGMNMQGVPGAYLQAQQGGYQQQQQVNYQQQMLAMQQQQQQQQQQQYQMQQMAQQMSNMNMGGVGYGQMQQPQNNAMQNNMGFGMGYGNPQPQSNQAIFNTIPQQGMYGGGSMANGNQSQLGGFNAVSSGMQNQMNLNANMWGTQAMQPATAAMGSGHTLSNQLWK